MKYLDAVNRLFHRIDLLDDCWIYTGASASGYGRMSYRGRCDNTHRIAYTEFVGDIPDGMVVCHSCDVKLCFNPDHLFTGTQSDNMKDMTKKMRRASGKGLSDAIKRSWTPKLRAKRAAQTKKRRKQEELQRRLDAGVPADWKFCGKSRHWLPRSNFSKNRARHDGLSNYCAKCVSLTNRQLTDIT